MQQLSLQDDYSTKTEHSVVKGCVRYTFASLFCESKR